MFFFFHEKCFPQISVAPAGFAIASASWDQTVLHFMFNLILDYHVLSVVRFECGVCDAARDLTDIDRLAQSISKYSDLSTNHNS